MNVWLTVVEVPDGKPPVTIGQETFHVAPRAGDFVKVCPHGEADDVIFEVVALCLVRALPQKETPAGDLILRRVGGNAEFRAAIAGRAAR